MPMMENMKMRRKRSRPSAPMDGRAETRVLNISCSRSYFFTRRKTLSILRVRRIVPKISKFEIRPSHVMTRMMRVAATTTKSNTFQAS